MSKPSYAAVAASPAKATHQQEEQTDSPPPYSGPSQSAATPQPQSPQPQRTRHHAHFAATPHQSYQGRHHVGPGHIEDQYHNGQVGQGGWTPPPSLVVARSRALRRFWTAFFRGWAIWIVIGLLIGGGVSDIERYPPGRHGHWGKHGRWHDDGSVYPK